VLRAQFKQKLLALIADERNRIVYIDETSFNAQAQPLKCWQFKDKPLRFAIPISRPHNITLFGGISNKLPKPVFYLAKSTNQHDLIVFLQKLRGQISEQDLQLSKLTYIVLDNHTAHKAKTIKDFIDEDERNTSHRFVLFFQPPYSSYYNSQETVWAHVKHRFRQIMSKQIADVSQEKFNELVWQACHDCNFKNNSLFRANNN
jgi:transposase